ncbi:MAG: hypothetical protein E8D47_08805 [Nitrospira sp.]|nr:MAG: hypothetical protein E8D47_08805 [Nitrospira sp.]
MALVKLAQRITDSHTARAAGFQVEFRIDFCAVDPGFNSTIRDVIGRTDLVTEFQSVPLAGIKSENSPKERLIMGIA